LLRRLVNGSARFAWKAACVGLPKGEHIVRYSMYRQMKEQLAGQDLGPRVLSVSHSNFLCKLLGADETAITQANYPDQQIDRLKFEDNSFSAVVSDQVLEHIECTPTEAVDEVYRVLRPGGLAIHTTCFLTPYHGSTDFSDVSDGDYWRYTQSGLARLHKRYAKVLVADGWGNPYMPLITGLGLTHMPVPEASWHPLNRLARLNRPSYAFVVWVAARK
jgi:SAM-dependent methyltransferase